MSATQPYGAAQRQAAASGAAAPTGRRQDPAGLLDVDVLLRRRTFTLDVALRAEPGEVVAVLGPNGAGKSTLLGIVSGLLAPHEGSVILGGRMLTGDGVQIPPAQRRVGLMGQDPLLFSHFTALENIAFGPRAQGEPKARARADAREWLARLGLAEFAERKPARLSGGQRQRVALARALAAKPDLLLLDEPLGALDAQTAPEIRQVLRTHIRADSLTTLLVTHDVLDAATLADRVIVLVDGAIADAGPTARVLAAPKSSFTAALAGLNLVSGVAQSAAELGGVVVLTPSGAAAVRSRPSDTGITGDGGITGDIGITGGIGITGVAAEPLADGAAAIAVFPPSAVAVYLEPAAAGSPRNMWPATVAALEPGTSAVRVRAVLDGGAMHSGGARPEGGVIPGFAAEAGADVSIAADLTPAAIAELQLESGSRVYLSVKATEVRVHAR